MAEQMTQSEIDALIKSLNSNGNTEEFNEIKYHLMICIYCKKNIESQNLDIHCLLAAQRCTNSKYGHKYVSEEWLNDRKSNNIPGWRRTYKLESHPRIRRVPIIKQPVK